MADVLVVSSLIAAGVFGLTMLFLLYQAWSFSSAIGSYRNDRRGKRNKNEKKLRKQYGTEHEREKTSKPYFGDYRLAVIHRMFHQYLMDYLFGATTAIFALYYVVQYTGLLVLVRASDGLAVNPFRWWLLQPIGAAVCAAMAGMFINHYIMDLTIVSVMNIAARLMLGAAILLAVNSTQFWVVYGVSAAITLVALLFLWGRESGRSSRRVSVVYYLFINLAYYLLFLASYEVEAWISMEWTLSLFPILDALAVIVPALVVMTDWYYKNYGVPLFPLFVYEAYAVGQWWRTHTSSELHNLWPDTVLLNSPNVHEHKHHRHGKKSVVAAKTTETTRLLAISECHLCGHTEEFKPKATTTDESSVRADSESGSESDESQ